jgi:hypothetical protein
MKKTENRGKSGGRKPVPTIKSKIQKYTNGGKLEYNFTYNILINQKAVIDNGWELDIIDMTIYRAIEGLINEINKGNNSCIKLDDNKPVYVDDSNSIRWYFISEYKILRDMPLLPLGSVNSVYKRISKLVDCGLIERNPTNEKTRLKLIRLGVNSGKMDYGVFQGKSLSIQDT